MIYTDELSLVNGWFISISSIYKRKNCTSNLSIETYLYGIATCLVSFTVQLACTRGSI